MRRDRVLTVARIDLSRLFKSLDYWIPMGVLAIVFFVILPFGLLTVVTSTTSSDLVNKIGEVLQSLPGPVQENVVGDTPAARGAYMLAVYLLAPVANPNNAQQDQLINNDQVAGHCAGFHASGAAASVAPASSPAIWQTQPQ